METFEDETKKEQPSGGTTVPCPPIIEGRRQRIESRPPPYSETEVDPVQKPRNFNKRLFTIYIILLIVVGGAAIYFSIASSRYHSELKKQIRINEGFDEYKVEQKQTGLGLVPAEEEEGQPWMYPTMGFRSSDGQPSSGEENPKDEECPEDWAKEINATVNSCSMKRKYLSGSEVEVKFNALRKAISRGGTHDVGKYIDKEDDDDFAAFINCIIYDFVMGPTLLELMTKQTMIHSDGTESHNQDLNLEKKVTSSSNKNGKAGGLITGETFNDNESKEDVYDDGFDSLAAYKAIAPNDLARRLPRPRLPNDLLRDMYGKDSSKDVNSIQSNEPPTLPLSDAFAPRAPIVFDDGNFQGADGGFSSQPPTEKGPLPLHRTLFHQEIAPRETMMMPSSEETPSPLIMPVMVNGQPPSKMPPLQPPPVETVNMPEWWSTMHNGQQPPPASAEIQPPLTMPVMVDSQPPSKIHHLQPPPVETREPYDHLTNIMLEPIEPPPIGPPAPYKPGQTFPAPPGAVEPIAPPASPPVNHEQAPPIPTSD